MSKAPPEFVGTEEFERRHVRPTKGRVLVVGSRVYKGREDRRAKFADAVGWDMLPGDGVDMVRDLEDALAIPYPQFSHVDCHSVLEHSRRPWLVAANIERLLVHGGTLFVAVPFIWRLHEYPGDYWRFTPSALAVLFPAVEWHHTAFVTFTLQETTDRVEGIKQGRSGHPYFPRTELLAFGAKLRWVASAQPDWPDMMDAAHDALRARQGVLPKA